jgi:SAM-dependent methyltransferase
MDASNRCRDQDVATRRFYDRVAEELADRWYDNAILLPLIERFVALLPDEPRVLELGCGAGYESKRLASVGAEVVGVDYSARSIAIARQRAHECRFEILDFREMSTDLGLFDGVFASASLIHISPDDIGSVFERVARVLRPGGYLLAIVKEGKDIRETWPIVNGERMRRILYLYTSDVLDEASSSLVYQNDMTLADTLYEEGWRAHLFRSSPQAE